MESFRGAARTGSARFLGVDRCRRAIPEITYPSGKNHCRHEKWDTRRRVRSPKAWILRFFEHPSEHLSLIRAARLPRFYTRRMNPAALWPNSSIPAHRGAAAGKPARSGAGRERTFTLCPRSMYRRAGRVRIPFASAGSYRFCKRRLSKKDRVRLDGVLSRFTEKAFMKAKSVFFCTECGRKPGNGSAAARRAARGLRFPPAPSGSAAAKAPP